MIKFFYFLTRLVENIICQNRKRLCFANSTLTEKTDNGRQNIYPQVFKFDDMSDYLYSGDIKDIMTVFEGDECFFDEIQSKELGYLALKNQQGYFLHKISKQTPKELTLACGLTVEKEGGKTVTNTSGKKGRLKIERSFDESLLHNKDICECSECFYEKLQ